MNTNNIQDATPEQIIGARRILRRRNFGLLLMFLLVPVVGTVHEMFGLDALSLTIGFIIMFGSAGLLLSVVVAKCPHCNKLFFSKWYWSNGFASKCVHCGLSGKE
jgi:hypothetical protein